MRRDLRLVLVCSLVPLGWLAQALPAEGGIRKIVVSGEPAPGAPAGWVFSPNDGFGHYAFEFNFPPLNGAGQAAIGAAVHNTAGSGFEGGIWIGDGTGPPALVALSNSPAPGLPGLGFNPSIYAGLNELGEAVFPAGLEGFGVTTANDSTLYGPSGSSPLALLVREGDPAPGAGAGVSYGEISGFFDPVAPRNPVNGAGQVAFTAALTGTGVTSSNDRSLWLTDGAGGVSLVAREGDAAPGTGAGVVFGSFDFSYALNEAGDVAFSANLAGTGVTTSNDASLWIRPAGGGLVLVARQGAPAPGMGPGIVFGISSFPFPNGTLNQNDLNEAGDLAFVAILAGPGITSSNDQIVFVREASGSFRVAAREGEGGLDPGIGPVTVALNDAGEVAFEAGPGQTLCSAVWGPDGSGGLRRIVEEGDPIPDLPGAVFEGNGACGSLPSLVPEPSINAHGDVAFSGGTLEGFGWGFFYASAAGELVTVVLDDGLGSDVIEVAPGDVRAVGYPLSMHPFATLNDARQLLFATTLDPETTAERGLFLAELYTDCVDGLDNDGDGAIDRVNPVGDPGCESLADPSEHARRWVCDNGIDDDGDGFADHPADPGCNNLIAPRENPQCQDGANNDGQFGIDFDGGASVTGVPGPADPQCAGRPWWNQEAKSSTCGLGFEAVLLLLPIAWLRARRRRGA